MAHERSIYKNDVDFSALALQDTEFNKLYTCPIIATTLVSF